MIQSRKRQIRPIWAQFGSDSEALVLKTVGRDMYFHNFELCEQGDQTPDRSQQSCVFASS